MVKNQNWERRVEAATARRKEVKQRKQKNEDKRQCKLWMQDLLRRLDQQSDRLMMKGRDVVRSSITLHVWADTMAAATDYLHNELLLDWLLLPRDDLSSPKSARRKSRSNSIEAELATTTVDTTTTTSVISATVSSTGARKGRGRSNSVTDSYKPSKRKIHPRSRDSFEEETDKEVQGPPPVLLCHSHFFTGRCEESRGTNQKKSPCRYLHYRRPYLSLQEVLSTGKQESCREELAAAASAAELAVSEDLGRPDPGSLEMMHYCSIEIQTNGRADSISSHIVSALSEKEVKHSSIVYLSLDDVLVYDRFREGASIANNEQIAAALADASALLNRKMSSVSDEGTEDEDGAMVAGRLPGTVLEHVLTFLPDASVGSVCRVCKSWYQEVGQNSPNLWRHLLERRQWPLPAAIPDGGGQDAQSPEEFAVAERKRYRQAFLCHYSVVRDCNAIKSGIHALQQGVKCFASPEVAWLDFSTLRNRPGGSCRGIHLWARNQVLAVYDEDCSIRLFESIVKSHRSEIVCKEVLCQTVDPYRNTKKRTSRLVASALDDDCIGCLCAVSSSTLSFRSYVLVVVNREEFLMGGSSSGVDTDLGLNLSVIDIGEAVLNYILSMDQIGFEELVVFLQNGGEIGDIEVEVSPSITACGYGRFMLDLCIFSHDGPSGIRRMVDQRLVLFSADVGAIVWMDSVDETDHVIEYKLVSSFRRQLPFGPRSSCSIAISSQRPEASPIRILDIEPSGEVVLTKMLQYAPLMASYSRCFIRLNSTHAVAFDSHSSVVNGAPDIIVDGTLSLPHYEESVVVTCFPRQYRGAEREAQSPNVIELGEDMSVTFGDVVCVRDEHMILLCRRTVYDQDNVGDDDFDSQDMSRTELWAVLVHIPSGHEIGRQLWMTHSAESIFMMRESQDTLSVGVSSLGIVMTGHDVRADGSQVHTRWLPDANSSSPSSPIPRKKKKNRRAKGNKKDAYARGMTMRG